MKKTLIALALASIALPAAAQPAPAAAIITVNSRDVIANSVAYKTAQPELRRMLENAQQRLQAVATALQAEEKNLIATQPPQTAPAATQQAFQAKVQEFRNKQQDFEQERQRKSSEIQASEQWVVKQISDVVIPIIGQVMRERNANLVLDKANVIDAAAALDVTSDVMARLDKALPRVSIIPPAPAAPAAPTTQPAPRPATPAPATPPRK